MDEIEVVPNLLGTIVNKVSRDYLFCAIYPDTEVAKKELMEKLASYEGQKVSARIHCGDTEIARGFHISGWWKVVAGELKKF